MKNEKRIFKICDINHIVVPRLDELSVQKMTEMMRDDQELRSYLPDEYFKE